MSQVTQISEKPLLEHIERRLIHEFPGVSPQEVDDLIHREHARFDASPIRNFIPLLVEKHAREGLAHLHEPTDPTIT